MAQSIFTVCWLLFSQPVDAPQNCAPPLSYYDAQAVMGYIVRSGEAAKASMSLSAGAPLGPLLVPRVVK